MKNRAILLTALFIAAAWVLAANVLRLHWPLRISGPLAQETYIWQRAWTEPVREAVAQHASNFTSLAVLKAEIAWRDHKPQVTRVAVDYPALTRAGRSVSLALRIGPYAGPFTETDATTTFLGDLAAALVADARAHQVDPHELQIDFDCPESKLEGYRIWLETIRRRIAPVPVTITVLPSWLKTAAFKPLAAITTNYVLQVHSLERPRTAQGAFTLCDPGVAQRAVERAGRIGVPFRVALPTYSYLVAFDRSGQFAGLSAEGPARTWPEGAQLREVGADPGDMAALIRTWAASRPAAMRGVIWYRLPVAADHLNWRWPTLAAVMSGRLPRESLRAESRRTRDGSAEISLINDGELESIAGLAVNVRWSPGSGARLVAGAGGNGFQLVNQSASAARFQTGLQPARLAAGQRLTIGWLRLNGDCPLETQVERHTPVRAR